MKVQRFALFALAAAFAPLASCHIHIDDATGSWTVNGERLDEEHAETIEVFNWDPEGLKVDVSVGDVRVVSTDGPTEIEATLRETMANDATLEYRDGVLFWETESGKPAAISAVIVRTNGAIPGLSIKTDAGDIEVKKVTITGDLYLSTGAGDIRVNDVGSPTHVELKTDVGDIRLSAVSSPSLSLSSDVGDLTLEQVSTGQANLDSQVGDIQARECDLGHLKASTDIGDIDVSESAYIDADLSTGIGDVDRADG